MPDHSGSRPSLLADAIEHIHHQPADDWLTRAACRGLPTEWWFPARGQSVRRPVGICAACPVRLDCAIDRAGEAQGVVGGLTARQRRPLRRAMLDAGVPIEFPPDARGQPR